MRMKRMLCVLLAVCSVLWFACAAAENCAHTDKKQEVLVGEVNKSEKTSVDADTHAYTHDIAKYVKCRDCNEPVVLETIKTGIRVEELHEFDQNGECEDCGYENACEHKNTRQQVTYSPNREYEYVDAISHRMGYTEKVRTYCLDCGIEIRNTEEVEQNTGTMLEGHEFFKGKCEWCGYEKPACAHVNTRVAEYTYERYHHYTNVSLTPLRHTYEADVYATIVCSDCGAQVEDRLDHSEIIIERHNYDEGSCTVCGYKPSVCEHEYTRVIEAFDPDNRLVFAINDKTHRQYGELAKYEVCVACEERVGDKKILEPYHYEDVAHSYPDGGRCQECDHSVICRHERTTVSYEYWNERNARPANKEKHIVFADRMAITSCADCGRELGAEKDAQNVKLTRAHDLTINGSCATCEYNTPWEGEWVSDIDELKSRPVIVPTLVSVSLPEYVQPMYEKVEKFDENTVTYEVNLKDTLNDEKYELEDEALLILPYPVGMSRENVEKWSLEIEHTSSKTGTEIYSTENGTIELLTEGLAVHVRSLSPFEIGWDEQTQAALPVTGDESYPAFWAMLLMLAVTALSVCCTREN